MSNEKYVSKENNHGIEFLSLIYLFLSFIFLIITFIFKNSFLSVFLFIILFSGILLFLYSIDSKLKKERLNLILLSLLFSIAIIIITGLLIEQTMNFLDFGNFQLYIALESSIFSLILCFINKIFKKDLFKEFLNFKAHLNKLKNTIGNKSINTEIILFILFLGILSFFLFFPFFSPSYNPEKLSKWEEWDLIESPNTKIEFVDYSNRENVMHLSDSSTSEQVVAKKIFVDLTNGFLDFYFYKDKSWNNTILIQLLDEEIIRGSFYNENSSLYWQTNIEELKISNNFSNNTWNHISIDFSLTSDTIIIYLNGIGIYNGNFSGQGGYINNIKLLIPSDVTGDIYYDLFGFSWEGYTQFSNYTYFLATGNFFWADSRDPKDLIIIDTQNTNIER